MRVCFSGENTGRGGTWRNSSAEIGSFQYDALFPEARRCFSAKARSPRHGCFARFARVAPARSTGCFSALEFTLCVIPAISGTTSYWVCPSNRLVGWTHGARGATLIHIHTHTQTYTHTRTHKHPDRKFFRTAGLCSAAPPLRGWRDRRAEQL